jgi:hypothetical protein
MRKLAVVVIVLAFAAASVALSARGNAAPPKPGLNAALAKTTNVASLRYALLVQINKDGMPLALHIRGQSDAHTIAVHLSTAGLTGGEMVSGPFFYQEAPDGLVVGGRYRWLRTPLARLPANSKALAVLHALTPEPLLQVIGTASLHGTSSGAAYFGSVAYDDPVVRDGLTHLTGGMEFRGLRVAVHVRQGLIHRFVLTGKTADGSAKLRVTGYLFAFGKPVHVTLPRPGTFMDDQLPALSD